MVRERSRGGRLPADAKSPKPSLESTPREHTKVRTQLAIFTGPAPSAPRYRAVVVSCSATRLPGGGLFCVCPAHFHCPPKVSARINAHIPAVSLSFFLLLRLFLIVTLRARSLSPRCLVVVAYCPFRLSTLSPQRDAARWTRDAAAAAVATTTATSVVALTVAFVAFRRSSPCTPLYLRGYSRANSSIRRNMRAKRGSLLSVFTCWYTSPFAARSSSIVRNVYTLIYLCVFFSFSLPPERKHVLFDLFLLPSFRQTM